MQALKTRNLLLSFVATASAFVLFGASNAAAIDCVRPGGAPGACVDQGASCLCSFENLPEGHILGSDDFPPSVTFGVFNNKVNHPDEAIIFDTACPGGCSGGDTDLATPGAGPGNDTAQGKIMVIAENIDGAGDDGLVDNPDDEHEGGTITLTFGVPYKLLSLKALDHEMPEELIETPSRVEIDHVGGGTQFVDSALLGDSSLENIVIPSPQPATEIRLVHFGSGGFDDLELVCACGDGIVDAGEDCDPPASLGGDASCSDLCTTIEAECGDGELDAGEECDPPASGGGDADCRDDCTVTVCGDGVTEGTEQCDPPGGICRDDCTLEVCGDDIVDPGEDCDPPESEGGEPGCTDQCTMDAGPECGDSNIDPDEECDPPASQGGDAACRDNCTLAVCGDELVEGGEECDPPSAPMGCNDDCTLADCGDGILDAGEDCDPPDDATGCNADCSLSDCGDDEVEAGEDCDPPGSDVGGVICTADCQLPECGDGVVEGDEECDPPGTGDCRDDCTLPACGDDIVDPNEDCDPPESEGGQAGCQDDCTMPVCGDDVVEGDEECEPPSVGDCRDDCTLMQCGDGILDPGEECEPAGVGDCRSDCTVIMCGDSIVDPQEDCDPPESQGGVAGCQDNCTLIECGDGVVDPGEECEPPGVGDCRDDCTLIVCGDGVVEGNEQCDPPLVEICNNMLDDDGDNLADCQDPECLDALNAMQPVCNSQCVLEPVGCTPIEDDPAVIHRNSDAQRAAGKMDYFKIHGRVRLDPPFAGGSIDPVQAGFAVTLRNAFGEIYSAELLPGDLIARTQKRFRFKDKGARSGNAKRDGLYAVFNRFRRFEREWYYVFRIKAYADLSGATLAEMTTQVYGVDGPGYLTVEWVETSRGWKLRRKDFDE